MSTEKKPEEGVNESRFYMWRAIFAMAHADGVLDDEEEAFIDKYLAAVPFSLHQRAVIEDDVIHPKSPAEMLAHVTHVEDRGTFFQFARAMVWSDGNYDVQEQRIMDRLFKDHMEQMDISSLTGELKQSKEDDKFKRLADEDYFKQDASEKVGLGALIGSWFAKENDPKLPKHGLNDSEFHMWRAVFALAHADDEVTREEQRFMYKALAEENFSDGQKLRLENDMEYPQDVAEMFKKITSQEDRSRFFYLARLMCWSDGNFDEQEQKIMVHLKHLHHADVDFDRLLSSNALEFDEADKRVMEQDVAAFQEKDDTLLSRVLRRIRK